MINIKQGQDRQPRLYHSDFSRVFSKLLNVSGVSCYQIAKYTGIDGGYLSCLRNGQKNNPSAEIVVKISLAITHLGNKVTLIDIEELFQSVGRSINVI